jgi:hypothetical protein
MSLSSSRLSRLLVVVVVPLLLLTVCGLLVTLAATRTNTITHHDSSTPRRKLADCETTCKNAKFKDLEYFDGLDMLQPGAMLEQFRSKRMAWLTKQLKKDYGQEFYMNAFEPMQEVVVNNKTVSQRVSVGRNLIFRDPSMLPVTNKPDREVLATEGPGWGRMVRKMQIKILQIQLGILQERMNAKPICLDDCAKKQVDEEDHERRFLKYQPSGGLYSKFTWATGGHRSVPCA